MIMSKELEQKAVELLDKLELLATEYTPEVYNAAASVVQINALSELVWGFGAIFFIVFAYFGVKTIWDFICKMKKDDKDPNGVGVDVGFVIITGIISLIAAIAGAVNLGELIQVWNWVALINPELGLAHKILGM